jgi:hypothetical protein
MLKIKKKRTVSILTQTKTMQKIFFMVLLLPGFLERQKFQVEAADITY